MMIERRHIEKVMQKVAEEYPEFRGIEPMITEREIKPQDEIFQKLDMGVPKQFRHIYRLKFMRVIETEDKVPIDRILLVTLDENFEIVKISESR
ncbi:MAG: hypothetical protein PVI51_04505 [candidate division WOR-3 bacterium]|jgi:hypothetical protein